MGHEGHAVRSAVVTGAGGFIGHHLVKYLKARGYFVLGIDIKEPQYEPTAADDFECRDLTRDDGPLNFGGFSEVYHLAADMGGIGYITSKFADIAANNVKMTLRVLEQCAAYGVGRVFFSSSACVYPSFKQQEADVTPLRETDAIPADPEKGYGWEKLFSEQLCAYYREDYGIETRVARFHNIYGPLGTFDGGREKAPAALCRKVALADPNKKPWYSEGGQSIEIWGDGKQTRSFLYVDDCVEGIYRLMQSDYDKPVNIGSDRLITIDELADIIIRISGKDLMKHYLDVSAPQGVRGRNSDNTLVKKVLGWEPQTPLEAGLERTYQWIKEQI